MKFLAAATLWTGLGSMPFVLLAASGSALTVIAVMRLRGREVSRRTRLRFGPYLAGALFAVLIVGRLVSQEDPLDQDAAAASTADAARPGSVPARS